MHAGKTLLVFLYGGNGAKTVSRQGRGSPSSTMPFEAVWGRGSRRRLATAGGGVGFEHLSHTRGHQE
jgi:hypothetical protein